MQANLCPGKDLEQLLKGPIATRQGDKGIRNIHQALLAGMHAANDFEAGQPGVHQCSSGKYFRDHPYHLASSL